MNIAVLLYQYVTDKPSGIPDAWPSQTVELGDGTDLPGDDWVLMTSDELATYISDHAAAHSTWATSYYAIPISRIVNDKIRSSMSFGEQLLIQFATENVLLGITQSGKTTAIVNYLDALRRYVSSGSLYSAITEIDARIADPDLETNYAPFLTVDRLTLYKQKIQAFLGI